MLFSKGYRFHKIAELLVSFSEELCGIMGPAQENNLQEYCNYSKYMEER